MTTNPPTETVSDVIEIWKLDLERLLWSYHENGRPDGKTGVIGNPKTIEEFVVKLMNSQYEMGKEDGRAMKKRAYCEVCRVLIDADTDEREKYA